MQITLKNEVTFSGVGLHSGKKVTLRLRPAEVDTGIVFVRTDINGFPKIQAKAKNVTSTARATTIEENGVKIFTIEHLMSALHGFSIDNCEVLIDAEEPPVADGSAKLYIDLLKKAQKLEQNAASRKVKIEKIYRVESNNKFVMALPYDGFRVSFVSINPHPLIGVQYKDFLVDDDIYEREIAPARTIAYEKEVEALQKAGLGLGGNLDNVIVYNDDGWLNPLRFPDELVRHKILDIIGDLRLVGKIEGHIIAAASGHSLNTKLAKMIENDI